LQPTKDPPTSPQVDNKKENPTATTEPTRIPQKIK